MTRWLTEFSLRFRLLALAFAALIIFFGVRQIPEMRVDVLPEFSEPFVEVQTEALGLSAEEVEQLITVPLEADLLNGVAWLKTIRSESIPGLSSIVLIFEPGTDVLKARQMVQERLTQAHGLPNVSKSPAMLQPLSSANRVMAIGLAAKDISHIDMSVLARWNIKPRLMGVNGVANVAIWGLRNRQLQVQVDPEHLKEKGVTLNQVIKTAGDALWVSPLTFLEASTPGTGGWVDTPNQRLGIRHVMPITTPEQLAKVAVDDAPSLALEQVATVVEDHQPLIGDAIVKGGPGLMLVIEKFPWANTLDVTRGVEKALDELRPGLSGIEVDPTLFRPASYIEQAMQNFSWALPISAILAIAVLFAFFYSWRFSLIAAVSIAASLMGALLVLHLLGTTLNMVVLVGIAVALGVVIDDAVADLDNIARRLRQPREADAGKSATRLIIEAALEMRSSIVYATVIILLVVAPLFFIQGASGAFLQPLILSYGLAVLVSMLVALIVTPALSVTLLSGRSLEASRSPIVELLRGALDPALSRMMRTPTAAYTTIAVLLIAGVVAWPRLGQESLLPTFKENDIVVEWDAPPGTSREAMNRAVAKASHELRSIPGVRNVSAQVGRAILSDEVIDVNSSELLVSIDPSADYDATVERIQSVVDGYPGLPRKVLTFLKRKTREALSGEDDAVVVRVYGQNTAVLREKAQEVKNALASIKGIVDTRIERQSEEPTLEIRPDLAKARKYGIKPGDIRRAAAAMLSGIEVGSLFEEQKVFEVTVWGAPNTRHSVTSVGEILMDTPSGQHVRLKDVAELRIVPALNLIEREGVARRIDVHANVHGRDLGSVANDIDQKIKQIKFPLEHHAAVLGEYAERQAAESRVRSFAIAAAIGIFLVLQAAFSSWRLATIVFLGLPAALAGGVLATYVGGAAVALGSLAGLLAVFAVTARQSVVLIRHFQHLEYQEGQSFGPDLVLRGVRDRFTPIALTAATMMLVVLPFVVSGKIAGHEILHPMAVVILGGVVTSTLINLFVIPALYLRFGAGCKPEMGLAEMQMGAN